MKKEDFEIPSASEAKKMSETECSISLLNEYKVINTKIRDSISNCKFSTIIDSICDKNMKTLNEKGYSVTYDKINHFYTISW